MHGLGQGHKAVGAEPGHEHSCLGEAGPSQPRLGDNQSTGEWAGVKKSSGDRGRAEGHQDGHYREEP